MTKRQALVDEARSWIGTPWTHQACLKGVAVDCIGLIVGSARAVGLLPDFDQHAPQFRGYSRQPQPAMLLRACDSLLDRVQITQVQPGDVFVLRFQIDPTHFAIITELEPLSIVHAYTQAGKVVEHRMDATWRQRVLRAYSFRGID